MKVHILTPFCKMWLANTLIHYLEPMNIEWYPICNPKEEMYFNRDWIHMIKIDHPIPEDRIGIMASGLDSPYRKINHFIDTQPIIDNDYYGLMGDDDMYEPGFFDVIRQQSAKILMCSGFLGNAIPPSAPPGRRHIPTAHMIQFTRDVFVGNIGFGQYIMRGEIFKQIRFHDIRCPEADGYLGVYLKNTWPSEIKILSDMFIFGNYFESYSADHTPERYTDKLNFLKSSWSLPMIYPNE